MSSATRQKLVNDVRLVLSKESQKTDLLDSSKTSTWLVEFLMRLIEGPRPILVTALNSDHAPGTLHNPPGRAVDCWHADWATVGDDKIVQVMPTAAAIGATYEPALVEVGLSGTAAYYKTYVTWPTTNVFVEDYAKSNEHVHFAIGTPW